MIDWKDQVLDGALKYKIKHADNTEEIVEISLNTPIIQEGTALNATTLSKLLELGHITDVVEGDSKVLLPNQDAITKKLSITPSAGKIAKYGDDESIQTQILAQGNNSLKCANTFYVDTAILNSPYKLWATLEDMSGRINIGAASTALCHNLKIGIFNASVHNFSAYFDANGDDGYLKYIVSEDDGHTWNTYADTSGMFRPISFAEGVETGLGYGVGGLIDITHKNGYVKITQECVGYGPGDSNYGRLKWQQINSNTNTVNGYFYINLPATCTIKIWGIK